MGAIVEKQKAVEFIGKLTQSSGNGNYLYIEAGVSKPLMPPSTPTSGVFRLGRTFD